MEKGVIVRVAVLPQAGRAADADHAALHGPPYRTADRLTVGSARLARASWPTIGTCTAHVRRTPEPARSCRDPTVIFRGKKLAGKGIRTPSCQPDGESCSVSCRKRLVLYK